ncbi:prepilin-type N-terminal cleavage/methylation domain-containing protein [Pontiellaceae bacterium B12219]|nr:prepilin-type N-terminal cleavage/methylation domain-containing protein [Pontiellaceae bacterium B12219]
MKTYSINNRSQRSGFSLIETMVALLLLSIIAVGGAALMQRTGMTVAQQNNKRAALAAAERRLEQLRAQPYSNINDGEAGTLRYASERYNDGTFRVVSSKPTETVRVNRVQRPVWVELIRFDETNPKREFVQATVFVEYAAGETVSLATNLR